MRVNMRRPVLKLLYPKKDGGYDDGGSFRRKESTIQGTF